MVLDPNANDVVRLTWSPFDFSERLNLTCNPSVMKKRGRPRANASSAITPNEPTLYSEAEYAVPDPSVTTQPDNLFSTPDDTRASVGSSTGAFVHEMMLKQFIWGNTTTSDQFPEV